MNPWLHSERDLRDEQLERGVARASYIPSEELRPRTLTLFDAKRLCRRLERSHSYMDESRALAKATNGRYLQNLVHRIPSAPFPHLQSRPDITHGVAVGERVVVIEDEGV